MHAPATAGYQRYAFGTSRGHRADVHGALPGATHASTLDVDARVAAEWTTSCDRHACHRPRRYTVRLFHSGNNCAASISFRLPECRLWVWWVHCAHLRHVALLRNGPAQKHLCGLRQQSRTTEQADQEGRGVENLHCACRASLRGCEGVLGRSLVHLPAGECSTAPLSI
jgi:hypothetical protein